MTVYLSFQVLDIAAREILVRDVFSAEDHVIGLPHQPRQSVSPQPGEKALSFEVLMTSLPAVRALRDFFDGQEGASIPFWVRSRSADFISSAAALSGTTLIQVRDYNAVLLLQNGTRHLYLPFTPSTGQFVKVEAFEPNPSDASIVNVTAAPALTGNLPADAFIEILYFCRFASDELVIRADPAIGPDVWRASLQMAEIQRETP